MSELSEVEQIVTDLLRIAKVAMPGKLYAEDPRVLRAQAWLDEAARADADFREIERTIEGRRPGAIPGRVPSVARKG